MKMLMNVRFPHEPFNTLVREGTVGEIIRKILDDLKPESIYFVEQGILEAAATGDLNTMVPTIYDSLPLTGLQITPY